MDWIINLPPASLGGLLSKPKEQLNDIENALRDAIEGVYTPEEIEAIIKAANLDAGLSKKPGTAVVRVRKI